MLHRVLCVALFLGSGPRTLGWAAPLLPTAASLSDATWQRTVQQIRSMKPAQLHKAMTTLQQANDADVPRISNSLHRRTSIGPDDYKRLLQRFGASVPNRKGRFSKAKSDDLDWLQALSKAPSAKAEAFEIHREALLSVALMRGLGMRKQDPAAAESLLRFAYRHRGAFRDECGRIIRTMGNAGVVALVRSKGWRDPLAFRVHRYAAYQLDRMDRAQPARTLASATEGLKVALLRAYGEVREETAVNAVIALTDHVSARVRRAARLATLRYLIGKPPRLRKRHLREAGGTESLGKRTLYFNYRQMTLRRLKQRLVAYGLSDETVTILAQSPVKLARKLFAKLDTKRGGRFSEQRDLANESLRKGQTARAVDIANHFLLDSPDHKGAKEFAATYLKRAAELESQAKYTASAALYTKAWLLLPKTDKRRARAKAKAIHQEARVVRNEGSSIDADVLLRDALAADPSLPNAKRELGNLQKESTTIWWYALFAGILLVMLAGLAKRKRRWL